MLLRHASTCPSVQFCGDGHTDADVRQAVTILLALVKAGVGGTLHVAGPRR